MKRIKFISTVAAAAGMVVIGATAMAATGPPGGMTSVTSDVAITKHNLSSSRVDVSVTNEAGTSNSGTANGTADTTEVCVFCHTPHGAAAAEVPLWNRDLPASGSFQLYSDLGTSTLDGSIAPVGSVSIACLSCHDGQTAMDSLINFPGSGTRDDTDWTFADGAYNNTTGFETYGTNMNPAGQLTTGIANIGTDLRDDHPVGIPYAGGATDYTDDTTFNDGDFWEATPAPINGQTFYYIETSAGDSGSRDRSDMILYNRSGSTDAFVECASCHDPHVVNASAGEVQFLRVSNAGSNLCLSCHNK